MSADGTPAAKTAVAPLDGAFAHAYDVNMNLTLTIDDVLSSAPRNTPRIEEPASTSCCAATVRDAGVRQHTSVADG
jgi:hypothetical protein